MPERLVTLILQALGHDLRATTTSQIRLAEVSLGELHPALEEVAGLDSDERVLVGVFFEDELVAAFAVGSQNIPLETREIAAELIPAADQLQDHVMEALNGSWPACPTHAHPLVPIERDGVAVWVCPDSGTSWGEIGALFAG